MFASLVGHFVKWVRKFHFLKYTRLVSTICHHKYFVSDVTSPTFYYLFFFLIFIYPSLLLSTYYVDKCWFLSIFNVSMFPLFCLFFFLKQMLFDEPIWIFHFGVRGLNLVLFIIICVMIGITSFSLFCFLNLCFLCLFFFLLSVFYPINNFYFIIFQCFI